MKEIGFVDTTLRDGQQSLWNGEMTTAMMLPIAPIMDEAGFECLDFMALISFDWCIRNLHENPLERIRLMAKAMPKTPLMTGGVLGGFGTFPDAATQLFMKCNAEAGMKRIRINEPYHDIGRITEYIKWSKAAGLTTVVALIYSYSPVHTDEYYAKKALEIAKAGADRIFIKDVDGLLTPERTQTLVPAILKNIDGIPLELHTHCTTGLAPLCCLEAIKLGIAAVHTAIPPLANGSSQPSVQNIMRNARRLGFSPRLNEKAVETIANHFKYIAKREGMPMGSPVEYDLAQYDHQLPGGMISNYRFELSKRGLEHRLGNLLEEIALIRKELGYPIMITPLSQYVGVQAILNITGNERYETVTDEVIKYSLGRYGELAAPVDENVLDMIMNLPRTKELTNWETPQPSLEELRQEFGPGISDEELLLRILASNQQAVDEVLAAEPMKMDYSIGEEPEMTLIHELTKRNDLSYIHVQKEDFSLTLQI